MMDNPRVRELDEIVGRPDIDPMRLHDIIGDIAEQLGGLRLLVDRYRDATDERVLGYIGMMLSRAARDPKPAEPPLGMVLDFLERIQTVTNQGILITNLNALRGLNSNDLLRVDRPARQELVAKFLVHCLERGDSVVRADAIDLLMQLWADQRLEELVPPSASAALKDRLAHLAAEEESLDRASAELHDDLASLRPFWEKPQIREDPSSSGG